MSQPLKSFWLRRLQHVSRLKPKADPSLRRRLLPPPPSQAGAPLTPLG